MGKRERSDSTENTSMKHENDAESSGNAPKKPKNDAGQKRPGS